MLEAHVPTAVSCTCLNCLNLSLSSPSLFPPIRISEEVWHVLNCPEYKEERAKRRETKIEKESVNVGQGGWEAGGRKWEVEKAHTD